MQKVKHLKQVGEEDGGEEVEAKETARPGDTWAVAKWLLVTLMFGPGHRAHQVFATGRSNGPPAGSKQIQR